MDKIPRFSNKEYSKILSSMFYNLNSTKHGKKSKGGRELENRIKRPMCALVEVGLSSSNASPCMGQRKRQQ